MKYKHFLIIQHLTKTHWKVNLIKNGVLFNTFQVSEKIGNKCIIKPCDNVLYFNNQRCVLIDKILKAFELDEQDVFIRDFE